MFFLLKVLFQIARQMFYMSFTKLFFLSLYFYDFSYNLKSHPNWDGYR